MANVKRKARDSRFEILRIVSMLLIMASHSVREIGSGYSFVVSEPSLRYFVTLVVVMFGNVGTFLFIIISCWFSTDHVSFKASRLLQTIWQTWTTCLLCVVIGLLFNLPGATKNNLIKELITPVYTQYWYVSAYVVFLIIEPLLQHSLKVLDDNKLLFITMVFLLFVTIFGIYSTDTLGNLGSFIAVFYLIAFIKRKPNHWFTHHSFFGIFLFFFILVVFYVIRMVISSPLLPEGLQTRFLSIYTVMLKMIRKRSIIQLFAALCIFFYIMHLQSRSISIINRISKYSFGVYLWHNNLLLRSVVWQDWLNGKYFYNENNLFILFLLIAPIVAFVIFSIIENIRTIILDSWLYPRLPWHRKMEIQIDRFYQWKK